MKTLKEIREAIDLVETEDKKLTTLIRAGLFDIHKLPLLKRALSKDNTKMSPMERNSLIDLLDTLIAHVTGDSAIFNKMRTNVRNESLDEAYEIAGDLPVVLILKRRSIRVFPDGMRVAMYWSDKLKTFISVPYSAVGVGYSTDVAVTEEDIQEEQLVVKSLREENLDILDYIIDEGVTLTLEFNDDTYFDCDVANAKALKETYDALDDENKEKMKAALNESESFVDVLNFSIDRTK